MYVRLDLKVGRGLIMKLSKLFFIGVLVCVLLNNTSCIPTRQKDTPIKEKYEHAKLRIIEMEQTSFVAASGEPFLFIHYFTRWWERWKSNSNHIIETELGNLKEPGFNTLFLVHQFSQSGAIPGTTWFYLARDHRLAKEAKSYIVPWLEQKAWDIVRSQSRIDSAYQQYGAVIERTKMQDGLPGIARITAIGFQDYWVGYS